MKKNKAEVSQAREPTRQIAKLNVAALARRHSEKSIQRLAEALDDEDVKVRIDAAVRLLDRGHGKPTQTIERGERSPDTMSDVELLQAIREAALGELGEAGEDSQQLH